MRGLQRLWKRLRAKLAALSAPGHFLCDSCRYDYRDACRRPQRPNATDCEDYERRGAAQPPLGRGPGRRTG